MTTVRWCKWKAKLNHYVINSSITLQSRIVCDRENEIKAFKSEEYWTITLDLEGHVKPRFQSKLLKIGGKKAEIANQADAESVVEDLNDTELVLEDIVKKERKRNVRRTLVMFVREII